MRRHFWMDSLPATLLLPVEGGTLGALGMELALPHLFAAGLLSPEFRVGAFKQRIVCFLAVLRRKANLEGWQFT